MQGKTVPMAIVKTGIEWSRIFEIDDRTFYRHFRVTQAQLKFVETTLNQNGLNKSHGGDLF